VKSTAARRSTDAKTYRAFFSAGSPRSAPPGAGDPASRPSALHGFPGVRALPGGKVRREGEFEGRGLQGPHVEDEVFDVFSE
jgi:hypothetical protein